MVKNPFASAGDAREPEFRPWVGKIPWSGKWQPTPVFLPRGSHGQRSLVGYSPWGGKESDTTEVTEQACTPPRAVYQHATGQETSVTKAYHIFKNYA